MMKIRNIVTSNTWYWPLDFCGPLDFYLFFNFHPELECWIFFSSFAAALFLLGLICTGREGGCNGKVQYWRIWLKRLIRCKMISNLWRWWSPSTFFLPAFLNLVRTSLYLLVGQLCDWFGRVEGHQESRQIEDVLFGPFLIRMIWQPWWRVGVWC